MHNELNGTNGIVESPAYPAKFYSDKFYSWRITVAKEYVVLLTLAHLTDTDVPYIKVIDFFSTINNNN